MLYKARAFCHRQKHLDIQWLWLHIKIFNRCVVLTSRIDCVTRQISQKRRFVLTARDLRFEISWRMILKRLFTHNIHPTRSKLCLMTPYESLTMLPVGMWTAILSNIIKIFNMCMHDFPSFLTLYWKFNPSITYCNFHWQNISTIIHAIFQFVALSVTCWP